MGDLTVKSLREKFPTHYLPLGEAAAYSCSHPQTLRKAFKLKELGGFRRGRRVYFKLEDLDRWMKTFEQRPSRHNR